MAILTKIDEDIIDYDTKALTSKKIAVVSTFSMKLSICPEVGKIV